MLDHFVLFYFPSDFFSMLNVQNVSVFHVFYFHFNPDMIHARVCLADIIYNDDNLYHRADSRAA